MELRTKIKCLWERLQIPEEEREAFSVHMLESKKRNVAAVRNPLLSDDCRVFLFTCLPSLQLKTELQRLELLKMNSIKTFIETIRTEIALYWEKCFYSLEQREAFAPYQAGESSGVCVCV